MIYKLRLMAFLMMGLITCLPGQGQWNVVSNMPIPVAGAQAFSDGSLIYLLGGYANPLDVPGSTLSIIQTYDPANGAWGVF